MASQKPQDYRSHRRWAPGYHFVTMPLVVIYLGWSIVRAVDTTNADTMYALVGALALVGVYSFVRIFPLKVQDRVIRLEERLRLARVLPAELQPAIDTLRASHLVALRFASDDQLPELVQHIAANPDVKPDAIKRQIRSWRADWFRV